MPLLETIKGVGGVIAQPIQSVLNAFTQRRSDERTFKANKEMAEYQYSKDLEMWNRTNEFNSPEAQMQRLKKAGLNPHLVYGSGGATTQAAQMPKYQAPTAKYNDIPFVDIPGAIQAFQDVQIKNAQINNLEQQNKIMQEEEFSKSILNAFLFKNSKFKSEILRNQMFQAGSKTSEADSRQLGAHYDALLKQEGYKHQLQILQEKGRASKFLGDQAAANLAKTRAATAYQRLMTDWYSGNQVLKMLGTFTGVAKGLFKGSSSGRANPGGLNRANSKKLEEFKKKFIQQYER